MSEAIPGDGPNAAPVPEYSGPMLKLSGVEKSFGASSILHGVSRC